MYSEKVIDELISRILPLVFTGTYTSDYLPLKLFNYYNDLITEYFNKGRRAEELSNIYLGKTTMNIRDFSNRKTATFIKNAEDLLFNGYDMKKTYSEFKQDIEPLHNTLNKAYLKTELNTAYEWATSARNWNKIIKNKKNKYVKYITMEDEKVRTSHRALNGLIFRIDDPILDLIAPPNDYNCRCKLISLEEADASNYDLNIREIPADGFRVNPGKSAIYFNAGTYEEWERYNYSQT